MGQAESRSRSPFISDNQANIAEGGDARRYGSGPNKFRHPIAAFFHIIFKFLAFMIYLFGGLFGQDFISTFVTVILLISMDFWVVKNVTGRLLAGLRWSNYIDDQGNSHWIFENKTTLINQAFQDSSNLGAGTSDSHDSADSSIFWSGLITASIMWFFLMLVALFRLNIQWFLLVTLALVLSMSNLYGYVRCRFGTSDIRSSVTQFVAKQVFFNLFTGSSSSSRSVA